MANKSASNLTLSRSIMVFYPWKTNFPKIILFNPFCVLISSYLVFPLLIGGENWKTNLLFSGKLKTLLENWKTELNK
jgi:hypothetical protein